MDEKSRRTILKAMAGTGAVGAVYGSTATVAQEHDCDITLDVLNFGEVCTDEDGESCLEAEVSAELGSLDLEVFEVADVTIDGDSEPFEVDATVDGTDLGITATFCPTEVGEFEATAIITVEDPTLGLEATVCLGLFGIGVECPEGCDVFVETIQFGEVCAPSDDDDGDNGDNGENGGSCLEADAVVDLSELSLPLDVFEVSDVEVVGDADAFEATVTLDDGELGVTAEFCPTLPTELEATVRITLEDPESGTDATICLDLVGTGIECEPDFQVEITDTNSPVESGTPLEVETEIENTGNEEDTQTIVLELDGDQQDSTEVTLAPGESQTITLTADTEGVEPGDYPVTVSSDDDDDDTTVTITDDGDDGDGDDGDDGDGDGDDGDGDGGDDGDGDGDDGDGDDGEPTEPDFQVEITDTNSPVESGTPFEVDVEVENTGDEEDTQTIVLELDGDEQDSIEVTLAPGESETVTLTADTEGVEPGDYPATISSDDDEDETTVTITAGGDDGDGDDGDGDDGDDGDDGAGDDDDGDDGDGDGDDGDGDDGDDGAEDDGDDDEPDGADFQVEITGTNSSVDAGVPLEVGVLVENIGDEEDTQVIVLELDGHEYDCMEVTLAPGESQTITLTADTDGFEPGDYSATVSSDDDEATTTVRIC